MQHFKSGSRHDGADAADSFAPDPLIHQPSPWLGRLLLLSLLVMLNTPVLITMTTGMDPYGFFTIDPVARSPYPIVLYISLNVLLAFISYAIYRFIWRCEATLIKAYWSPFRQNAVAVAIPVSLAMAPAFLLCNTGGKAYYIIVGVLIAAALCVISALRNPSVKLDPGLATVWYGTAVGCILVLLALALIGTLYFHSIEQIPASSNFIWRWGYEWADLGYGPEDFPQRQRDGLVMFAITGIAYMVIVFGGVMLVSISDCLRRTTLPTSTPGKDLAQTTDKDPAQWGAEILERLRNEVDDGDEVAYVAVFGGVRGSITTSQYRHLVEDDEKSGLLRDAGLIVDRAEGTVRVQTKDGWESMDFRVGNSYTRGSGPFELLCIYARCPGHRFKHHELERLLSQVLSARQAIAVRDIKAQLRRRKPKLPVKLDDTESFMPTSVRVCFLDRRQPPDF